MPLPSDPDPAAEPAVQRLLAAQPGHPIPSPVRARILAALADESATRAVLLGNDAGLTADPVPFTKNVIANPVNAPESQR